jgi:hypothetical protein
MKEETGRLSLSLRGSHIFWLWILGLLMAVVGFSGLFLFYSSPVTEWIAIGHDRAGNPLSLEGVGIETQAGQARFWLKLDYEKTQIAMNGRPVRYLLEKHVADCRTLKNIRIDRAMMMGDAHAMLLLQEQPSRSHLELELVPVVSRACHYASRKKA